ncbi:pilus biosynthesis protein [Bifidobacterium dolichotidis]|uniref:Pilus biosynthesis protein n=1 Tax=Bifidobacterium dolichotidis TaxID=2306976 RepID=A0A430FQP5_9BIFI|nr:ATPase, T2SS/T4P/T4SS family [Bifidobacterium dolichotidis]RSX55163.1 pilus biosynthesis protein [Bifidobacterium dolichotidis]
MTDSIQHLGPLAPLAALERVTDVLLTPDGQVWIDRGSGMELAQVAVPLTDPDVQRMFAMRLCAQLGSRLDEANPIADAAAVDGLRVHAVIAPIVPQGAAVSIRLPEREALSLAQLEQSGLCPHAWVVLLRALVQQRANVLICGGTGSGKTTLLKAMLLEADDHERIVAVEEVRELGALAHRHVVSLVARQANVEGAGAIDLAQLVKATLRMRPDRIVLGECRGEEIADLLRALNSGHRGSMTTLHADSVERVPARLIALGLLAGVQPQALALLAHGAFHIIVHLSRQGSHRFIDEIGCFGIQDGSLAARTAARWDGQSKPQYSEYWQTAIQPWCGVGQSVKSKATEPATSQQQIQRTAQQQIRREAGKR